VILRRVAPLGAISDLDFTQYACLSATICRNWSFLTKPSTPGKADVLFDEPQQMSFWNLIFQTVVVKQGFGTIVLPHRD
jgi:hypothetical protein